MPVFDMHTTSRNRHCSYVASQSSFPSTRYKKLLCHLVPFTDDCEELVHLLCAQHPEAVFGCHNTNLHLRCLELLRQHILKSATGAGAAAAQVKPVGLTVATLRPAKCAVLTVTTAVYVLLYEPVPSDWQVRLA